jgi:hypothetical protein
VGGRAGVRVAHTSQWLTEEAQIKNVSTAVEWQKSSGPNVRTGNPVRRFPPNDFRARRLIRYVRFFFFSFLFFLSFSFLLLFFLFMFLLLFPSRSLLLVFFSFSFSFSFYLFLFLFSFSYFILFFFIFSFSFLPVVV